MIFTSCVITAELVLCCCLQIACWVTRAGSTQGLCKKQFTLHPRDLNGFKLSCLTWKGMQQRQKFPVQPVWVAVAEGRQGRPATLLVSFMVRIGGQPPKRLFLPPVLVMQLQLVWPSLTSPHSLEHQWHRPSPRHSCTSAWEPNSTCERLTHVRICSLHTSWPHQPLCYPQAPAGC